jgi:hypothetical protein
MTLAPRDVDQCAFFAADTPTGNTVDASFARSQPAAILCIETKWWPAGRLQFRQPPVGETLGLGDTGGNCVAPHAPTSSV